MAKFVAVGRADDLREGDMRALDVQRTKIDVANVGGSFYVFGDTCTHMQCSLAEGDLEETTVICLCHGSEFDVTTGEVLTPSAREPIASYETRVVGENIEIKV